jgi:hypothetical protein
MTHAFNIKLGWYEDQCAEQEGNYKSPKPFPDILPSRPTTQGIVCTYSREYKEKGHDPLTQDTNKNTHPEI